MAPDPVDHGQEGRPIERTPASPGWRPCAAHRRDGQPCRAPAIRGGNVCAMHGGRAPQVRAAAERRVLAERARRVARRQLGGIVPVDPHQALRDALGASWADAAAPRELAAEGGPYSAAAALAAHGLERVVRFARATIDVGVAERGQALREAEGAVIADLIVTILGDPRMQLTPAQKMTGRIVGAELLRRLEAGGDQG